MAHNNNNKYKKQIFNVILNYSEHLIAFRTSRDAGSESKDMLNTVVLLVPTRNAFDAEEIHVTELA